MGLAPARLGLTDHLSLPKRIGAIHAGVLVNLKLPC